MSGVWTCPRNHRWRPNPTDSATLDAVQPCPVCGAPGTLADADDGPDDPTLTRHDAPRPVPPAAVHVPGYTVTGEIGRGAMGVVYRATETALNRPVALKMILAGPHARGRDVARFRREVGTVAALRHPNIVQIYSIGEAGGLPYCALELVEGGSLSERVRGHGPLDPRSAARLVADLARAVDYAHRQGIVHRDLKPANVLLDLASGGLTPPGGFEPSEPGGSRRPTSWVPRLAQFIPKITDFGLAKLGDDSSLTGSATVLGTPAYMPPEQADGRGKDAGPAADVYSLGAILYECLTGRPPFKAGSALETLQQVLHDDPAPVRRAGTGVPRDLETVCLKCLEKDPARRYASAAALAEDLERFLAGEPVRARPLGWAARAVRWATRHRAVLTGAAAATVVTLLVVSVWPEPTGDAGHAGNGGTTAATGGGTAAAEEADLVVRVGDRTGPGSLYFERGVVLTSTDLLGMPTRDSPPPAKVEVVYHPGRPDERTYPAEVVSAEPTAKLAVLRLKGEHLPDPPQPPAVAVAAATPPPPAPAEAPPDKPSLRSGKGASEPEVAAAAVVQLRTTAGGEKATGVGFFAGPPGVVVTAAPLFGGRDLAQPPPTAVEAVVRPGTPAERALPARLLAVDRDAGLAVLQVEGDDLPVPLPVAPAGRLAEGHRLHAATAASRPAEPVTLTGRILTRNGGVRYLQVEAGRVAAGTPVVDADGRLVGVAEASLTGTRLHFLTPAEYVGQLLDGRLLSVMPGQPVAGDGGAKLPVTARLADPLDHVRAVSLAVWAGDPGPVRPASATEPRPRPGDGPVAVAPLRLAEDDDPADGRRAEGSVAVPRLAGKQVVWVRPRYLGDGGGRWGEAVPLGEPPPPVRAEPAELRSRSTGDGRVAVVFRMTARAADRTFVSDWTAVLAEQVRPAGDGASVRYAVEDLRSPNRAATRMLRDQAGGLLDLLRRQTIGLDLAATGAVRAVRVEAGGGSAPREDAAQFGEHVAQALAALAVPLPNGELRPGEGWAEELRLRAAGPGGKSEGEVPWEVAYRYAGRRDRGGRAEAVVEMTGRPSAPGAHGDARGWAAVDLATGRAVLAHVQFNATAPAADGRGRAHVAVHAALARTDRADGPAPELDLSALPPDVPVHLTPVVR